MAKIVRNVTSILAKVDLDGLADGLILDADGDTSISSPTDDQIDIEIAGADDFTITANSFNVLTGSKIDLADSATITLGTGDDATIAYDGTNLVVTPAAVGTGDISVVGASAKFVDSEGIVLGTGGDASIVYDGTDLVIDTSLVGTGVLKVGSSDMFTANATATVTISNVAPAAVTTATIAKWLTIKDDSGTVFYIPMWGA